MTLKNTFKTTLALIIAFATKATAQAPQANFSISPNPVCAGDVVHITDLSSNTPTSWSYTLNQNPVNTVTSSVQNPTITYNNAGTRTITLIATNASGASTAVSHTLLVIAAPNLMLNPANPNTCPGSTVGLTATTGSNSTLAWNTGATTSTIIVSPSVTTTYSCIATNSAGCSTTRSVIVTVGQPTVTINGNPGTICGGSSALLTSNSTGQGPFTFQWSNAATTKTISTNLPGVYTTTVTNSSGCSGTRSFTVTSVSNITVTAQSGQSIVCSGANVNMFATGASTYSWSSGSTTQVNMVTPNTSTNYTVIGASGTCTGSAVVSIVVNTIPTIAITSTPNPFCKGSTATITASGATTYSWTTGAAVASTTVSPLINTTYTVRGVNQGCQPRTATVSIVVKPLPVVTLVSSADTVCMGQAVTFTASGALNYSSTTGATTQVFTDNPSATGAYSVTGTDANGCAATASIMEYVTTCTGIKTASLENNSLLLYPNPNSGNFTLSAHETVTLNVINETGQLIKTILLNGTNSYSTTLTGLSTGIYFIVGQSSGIKQKVIVQ